MRVRVVEGGQHESAVQIDHSCIRAQQRSSVLFAADCRDTTTPDRKRSCSGPRDIHGVDVAVLENQLRSSLACGRGVGGICPRTRRRERRDQYRK
jgi:hypothetical protein